ncbi:hypothetical protein DMX12_23565 [Pseudomonas sp. MB-090624]|nr:hypothetical protein DMX12_23565 [Pseudomonas sp. MB-090624]
MSVLSISASVALPYNASGIHDVHFMKAGASHRVVCFAGAPAPTGIVVRPGDFFGAQRQNPYLHVQIGVLRNES